jgi:hypothetical protein
VTFSSNCWVKPIPKHTNLQCYTIPQITISQGFHLNDRCTFRTMCAVPSKGVSFSSLMSSIRVRIQVFSENDHVVTDITFDFAFYVSIF